MKDSLSLMPAKHIIHDKSYCNLTEFALQCEDVRIYLCNSGADEKACDGVCSDFDVLHQLIESIKRNGDKSSRVYRYFSRVLKNCFGISSDDVISGDISTDELWHTTSEALLRRENSLHGIISRSELDTIGVAQTPWEYEKMPDKIGNTVIKDVMCPLGARGKSILDAECFSDLAEIRRHFEFWTDTCDCAVLLNELDFEFEEPNLYVASTAYDKIKNGSPLKDNERRILKSQLLRDTFFACAENGRKLMLALPTAANAKILYQTEQLLKYVDESLRIPISLTLFASDAVGFSFACAVASKKHKKITAEAAIGGADCYLINEDEIKYWGVGKLPERYASLSHTPSPFSRVE